MKEQIELIRSKCIETNPSIKDLVFGCRFIDLESTQTLIYLQEENTGAVMGYSSSIKDTYTQDFRFEDESKIEILGRDIRLADVLLAIGSKNNGYYYCDMHGNFCNSYDQDVSKWNLKQDSLEDQSPETIEFIANLLK